MLHTVSLSVSHYSVLKQTNEIVAEYLIKEENDQYSYTVHLSVSQTWLQEPLKPVSRKKGRSDLQLPRPYKIYNPGYSGGHSHRVCAAWSSPPQQDNLLRGKCFWNQPSRQRPCSLWEEGSGVCGQDEVWGPLYGEYQVGYEGSSQVLVIPGTACNVTLTENYCSLTRRYRESSGPTFRALLRTSLLSRPHQFPVRDSSLSVGSSARTRDAISLPRTLSVMCCWRLILIFKDLH